MGRRWTLIYADFFCFTCTRRGSASAFLGLGRRHGCLELCQSISRPTQAIHKSLQGQVAAWCARAATIPGPGGLACPDTAQGLQCIGVYLSGFY